MLADRESWARPVRPSAVWRRWMNCCDSS